MTGRSGASPWNTARVMDANVREFWNQYLASLPSEHPHRDVAPDVFGFGDSEALIEELAALVVSGKKRATTSLPVEYTALGEALPKVGDVSIVLRAGRIPAAIVERIDVQHVRFSDVDDAYATYEGEGDGSLQTWRADHRDYFAGVCARLGGSFDDSTIVICQKFKLVWPESLHR
jgi:uncharacterized protein YhfF